MQTVIHQHDDDGQYCFIQTDDDTALYMHPNNYSYLIGEAAPHYPVPAIQMHVEFLRDALPIVIETFRDTFDDTPREACIRYIGDWEYLFHW